MAQNQITGTVLGDALRRLGDLLDSAPSIQTAAEFPNTTHKLTIYLTSPIAVQKVAEDLALPVVTYGDETNIFTSVDVTVGPVEAHIAAAHKWARVLHRSSDVTSVLEEQADAA